ncbi:serine/threonine-protein kinase [Actinoplanes sp. NPDC051411]|uniref:serine/threonine-protein kinase n=1 Tax=Actinoplanes sp. NPDC051411 TaxID=3155522 RepID=UPI003435A994
MTLGPGVRLGGRYRLDVRIGAGGMGEVWRGTDEVLGRTVAVKVMLPAVAADPGFAHRFLSEATAMARVNHPAVASIHDYGSDAGVTYLVMEFVDGESLGGLLARVGRLGPADTMRVIAQAAEGLQAVHAAGLVHRDVKPANLLVRPDGQVVVTDFGISRHEDASRLTASGAILGTPSYLSPEQVLGHPVGPLTDVYALGLTAYECLAGQRPFQADNPYAVAILRVQQAPRSIGFALPPPVLAVVEGALAVDPGQRWPSAAALADAARTAAAGLRAPGNTPPPVGHTPHPPAPSPPGFGGPPSLGAGSLPAPGSGTPPPGDAGRSRTRSRVSIVAAFVVVLLAGAGIAVWGVTRGGGHGDEAGASTPGGTATSPAKSVIPAGFRRCDAELCPTEEMCWGGITNIAGRIIPPKRADCGEPHYVQTFAAIPLPDDVDLLNVDTDALLKRPDVKKACSRAFMQQRSKDQKKTGGWLIDAWPIPTPEGGSTSYLHCVAGNGPTTGSAF